MERPGLGENHLTNALGLVVVFSLIAHAAVATLQGSAALPPIHYSFFQSFKCTVTGADGFLGLGEGMCSIDSFKMD